MGFDIYGKLREGEKVSVGVDIHRGDRFSDTQRVIVFVYRGVLIVTECFCACSCYFREN